jgi:hypothetical protein
MPFPFSTMTERTVNAFLAVTILFILGGVVYGATPNPGHPWSEVGDGLWASTGTAAFRTFTFPDASATVMTTLGISQGDIIYGDGASSTATLAKDTNAIRYLSNTGASNNPAWAQINLPNGVTGSSSFANGGTATSLTANNGGILYSASAALAILAGNGTAGKLLRAGSNAAPAWSTAMLPSAPVATNDVLMSNGTNWQSTFATTSSVAVIPYNTLGTIPTPIAVSSLTVFFVGMFNVPARITVNQISASLNSVVPNPSGSLKQCIYDERGTKMIDVTSASGPSKNTTLSTAVSPSVTLMPGNYYYAVGCGAACSIGVNFWGVTAAGPYTTLQPAGKKVYEGNVTMTSGTCNATLPTITAVASSTPVGRLDN